MNKEMASLHKGVKGRKNDQLPPHTELMTVYTAYVGGYVVELTQQFHIDISNG